jgi:hypothetical protein
VALIDCPECESQVSDKAVSCPKCGWVVDSATFEPFKLTDTGTGFEANRSVAAMKLICMHAIRVAMNPEAKHCVLSEQPNGFVLGKSRRGAQVGHPLWTKYVSCTLNQKGLEQNKTVLTFGIDGKFDYFEPILSRFSELVEKGDKVFEYSLQHYR